MTNGHLDIVTRAAKIFDHVTIAVLQNRSKRGTNLFDVSERMQIIREATAHLPNVSVDSFQGLTAEYARDLHVKVIVRGLRAISDYESELQIGQIIVYPKASRDIVLLDIEELTEYKTEVESGSKKFDQIQLIDGTGKLVKAFVITSSDKYSLTGVSKGLYYLKLITNKETQMFKLLIE